MEQKQKKLTVNNLKISFRTADGNVQAVRDISFDLYKGETLAIVGESGSGKSVTNRAVMGILAGNAIKEGGEILYDGRDLMKISEEEFHRLRGDKIAMIFQDPMSSLNPIMRVGKQLTEAMLLKGKRNQKESRNDFNYMLRKVRERMDEAMGDELNADVALRHKQMCADFDKFEYKHLELENAYNRAKQGADDALENIEEVLFRIEKSSTERIRGDIEEVLESAARAENAYVVSDRAEELKAAIAAVAEQIRLSIVQKTKNFFADLTGKKAKHIDNCDYEAVKTSLETIREILSEAVVKPMPNFFAMGYYLTFATEPLPDLEVNELNVFLRKYLDDNFMLAFIDEAKRGVEYSHKISVAAKERALEVIAEQKAVFEVETPVKKEFKAAAKAMAAVVKKSIDPLEVVKDPLSYTFASSLKAALDEYFGAVGRNKYSKDGEDNTADVAAAKADIYNVLERIESSFAAEIIKECNEEDKTVAVIDYLKAKASGVAYKVTRGMAKTRAIKLLKEVGIPDPARRYRQYPFEFSGGMRQRIVIAIALSADPDILICDEPTTALDVTIQSQILELINKVKKERDLSVIFITHNLGVVANMADRVAVMYAGKIVEIGTADDIFYSPAHPYTWALLSSMPDLDTKEALEAIPGTPPNMIHPPKGDAFAERNRYALKIDFEEQPPMFRVSDTHYAATWLLHPDAPKVDPPKSVTERIERMKARRASYESATTVTEG